MKITVILVNTHHLIKFQNKSKSKKKKKILHYMPGTYSSYNLKFVPLGQFHPIPLCQHPDSFSLSFVCLFLFLKYN